MFICSKTPWNGPRKRLWAILKLSTSVQRNMCSAYIVTAVITSFITKGKSLGIARTEDIFLNSFDSMLRIKIAEYAKDRVFLHAGVVGWNEKAIVFPGDSFDGKSTLAAEFVRAGAVYFSDEYAVLDYDGLVHPFPRSISLRNWNADEEIYDYSEISAESLGGSSGHAPLQVGVVLFTKFEENAIWQPEVLRPGQAIIEILSQTIPIRYAPQFSLKVLKNMTSNAILLKSSRGDARKFVKSFLDFVDNEALLAKMLNTYST